MQWLRFADLKARGIVNNRVTLKRRQQRDGFPSGKRTGPNEVSWTDEEIDAWREGCPDAGPNTSPALKGAAKTNYERACGKADSAATTTTD
jgi:hypothetical protein